MDRPIEDPEALGASYYPIPTWALQINLVTRQQLGQGGSVTLGLTPIAFHNQSTEEGYLKCQNKEKLHYFQLLPTRMTPVLHILL